MISKDNIVVSFITINYNSSVYTIELIKSIEKYTSLKTMYEIIIVDNASDNSDYIKLKEYANANKRVQLIKNEENEGFSAGNMLGAEYASGKYFLFINNDTELLNDVSFYMVNYLERNSAIALATSKVKNQYGSFASSYKLFPSLTKQLLGNSMARKFSKENFPSNKIELTEPTLVEVVSGACMFFRASDFRDIGGFDKSFFLYCEEEDLSKRVWNYGKKVVFLPEAEILHHSGGSSTKSFEMEREYYISYHILLKKHFNTLEQVILRSLLLFKLFRRSFKRKYGVKLFWCALKACSKNQSLRN